ncbi:HEAT repeat domain-containing protein [Paenibacillus cremeus]|uniref:HEAT repeat domain-containing protein n=1 Tax=Paenibacillus cremeus TaxID=2163881 RepID=A0A559KFL3_9BACL|nr:HEAT repeat domain-containing protein [Paenibacillus cremeus]TVY10915.1 HEAT repeat domain-containing protein [Paenibacillus cremeus]
MSQYGDLGAMGRHYLQAESYGAAAFCFYRALLEDQENANAWNGLVLSHSLMRKEHDSQTILARFALQDKLPYDRDMITFAMMFWQQNPLALSEWVRSVVTNHEGCQDSETLLEMADDLVRSYQELVERHGEETLRAQGMLSLAEIAARRTELDWLATESFDAIYEHVRQWMESGDTDAVLTGVRMLCMLPDPRSEKLLRRACRNEEFDGKVRTQALLALRWLGVRGNAKIYKMGESFVIDLDDPKPELTVSVPTAYKPALDRMKLWLAKQQGFVTPEEYESFAATDEAELPEELVSKVNEADIPGVYQEVVHMLIRAAYDKYYPLVPTVRETRQWANALLMLMKDYVVGIGESWTYGEPEQEETAVRHRNWLLSGTPDYYESVAAAKQLRESLRG